MTRVFLKTYDLIFLSDFRIISSNWFVWCGIIYQFIYAEVVLGGGGESLNLAILYYSQLSTARSPPPSSLSLATPHAFSKIQTAHNKQKKHTFHLP